MIATLPLMQKLCLITGSVIVDAAIIQFECSIVECQNQFLFISNNMAHV